MELYQCKSGDRYIPHRMGDSGFNGKEVTTNKTMTGFAIPGGGLLWGIITLIFGVIVMIFPKILVYLVGMYLVVVGLLAIIASLQS